MKEIVAETGMAVQKIKLGIEEMIIEEKTTGKIYVPIIFLAITIPLTPFEYLFIICIMLFRQQRDKRTDRRDEKESSSKRDDYCGESGSRRDGTGSNRRDGERGSGRIFRDKDRERERERDRQERGYGHDRRGHRDGREKDGRRNRDKEETKRPIILAKPAANKEKDLEKQRDEEFPTLQQAHHRDTGTKTPPPSGAVEETTRSSEDRLLEVGKLLLGRNESVGKSQTNNSGSDNIATVNILPSKAASPRPPADDLPQPMTRITESLNMDNPPYKEKVF